MPKLPFLALLGLLLAACGGSPAPITVTIKTSTGLPVNASWVAFQDGDGPWQAITNLADLTYSFPVKSGRYGVVMTCVFSSGDIYHYVDYRSTQDTTELLFSCSLPSSAIVNLTGNLSGLAAGQTGEVWMGGIKKTTFPYSYATRPGTYDLLALRRNAGVADSAILKRGVVLSGNKVEDFDFAGSDAFALPSKTISVSNSLSSEVARLEAVFFTGKSLSAILAVANAISLSFPAIPTSKQIAKDYHRIRARTDNFTANTSRSTYQTIKDPPDTLSLELPPIFASPTFSLTPAPNPRPGVTWTAYPGAQAYDLVAYQIKGGSKVLTWIVSLSPNWLGSTTSYTLPDLSALPGWDKAWEFNVGEDVSFSYDAYTTNIPTAQYFRTWPEEYTQKLASKAGVIKP